MRASPTPLPLARALDPCTHIQGVLVTSIQTGQRANTRRIRDPSKCLHVPQSYRGESRGEEGSHGGLGTPRTHRTRVKRAVYISIKPNIAFLLRDIGLIPKHDFGPHIHITWVHRAVKALEHAVSVLYRVGGAIPAHPSRTCRSSVAAEPPHASQTGAFATLRGDVNGRAGARRQRARRQASNAAHTVIGHVSRMPRMTHHVKCSLRRQCTGTCNSGLEAASEQ